MGHFCPVFCLILFMEVMAMEFDKVVLMDLPTSVRGFVFLGDDGEPVIVVNSRLTREANQKTYLHELKHIENGDMYNPDYNEYGGD